MTEETKTQEPLDEKSLDKMTVKELREIAMGIPHSTAVRDMKKDELLALIKEAKGIRGDAPVKKKKKVVKLKMTKAELKAKIRELKAMRLQALEAKEGKKAAALRHRISGLKKKSRRVAGA
jgi:protein-arginine kinase activator protein McsA